MGAAAVFAALTTILTAQTNLFTAVVNSQPPDVRVALWTRFSDDTKWIHDGLNKLNGHLEKIIGSAPDDTPAPAVKAS